MLAQALGEELSPLQREIVSVTKTVTVIAVAMGVIFFIAAFIRAWRSLKQGEKEKGGPER